MGTRVLGEGRCRCIPHSISLEEKGKGVGGGKEGRMGRVEGGEEKREDGRREGRM